MIWLVMLLTFLSVACIGLGLQYVFLKPQESAGQAIKRRLASVGFNKTRAEDLDQAILRQTSLSSIGFLNYFLKKTPRLLDLQKLLYMSGSPFNLGALVLLSSTLAIIGILLGVLLKIGVLAIGLALLSAYLPILILKIIKDKRLAVFESQFPEAVDLMTRALRAGHSFSLGMRMVADEMSEPTSSEFARTFDDYSYGKTIEEALGGLVERVELADVKFFASAVSLQRETGGKLTEILDNISYIIRERFRLLRTVKALSAEGRLSGIILAIMPPALVLLLYVLCPEYISVAFEHPLGQMILIAGGIFEILGIIVIKRIIKLDV